MVVALQQHDVRALARGSSGSSGAGWAATYHQHIALTVHLDVAAGLMQGSEFRARRLRVAFEDIGLKDALVTANGRLHLGEFVSHGSCSVRVRTAPCANGPTLRR